MAMIEEIPFFDLWNVFENDKLYGNEFTVRSLIEHLSEKNTVCFEFYYEDSLLFRTSNTANTPSSHVLEMSELLTDAYKNDPDNDVKSYRASSRNKHCESLIYCLVQCGLKYERHDKQFIFDPYRHDLYDFVRVAGAHKIKRQDFTDFFDKHRLPIPYRLDKQFQYNSLNVHNFLLKDKGDWNCHVEAEDIIDCCAKLNLENKTISNSKNDVDGDIFRKCGGSYEIIFNDIKMIERGIGFDILYYIVRNSPNILSLNHVHAEIYKENIIDTCDDEYFCGDGVNLNFDTEISKDIFIKKKEKINIALTRAINKIEQHNPELASHFRHFLSRKRDYTYSPPQHVKLIAC